MRKTFKQLRKVLDGQDPFMTTGHQILKVRRQKRECPEWAKHDDQVRGLLLRSFPDLETDEKQRFRAARWLRIIHLYYRQTMTEGDVAAHMGLTLENTKALLMNIRRASRNLPINRCLFRHEPSWRRCDQEIRTILIEKFPGAEKRGKRQTSAVRWLTRILLYPKGASSSIIAADMNLPVDLVERILGV